MRETQRKGDIAVTAAIAYFTLQGWDVSIPLTESAAYDIVVDTGLTINRVQVRFTSSNEVELRRIHSNSSGYVIKKTKKSAYDWLFVHRLDGRQYLIKACLDGRRSIRPNDEYLVATVAPLQSHSP